MTTTDENDAESDAGSYAKIDYEKTLSDAGKIVTRDMVRIRGKHCPGKST